MKASEELGPRLRGDERSKAIARWKIYALIRSIAAPQRASLSSTRSKPRSR